MKQAQAYFWRAALFAAAAFFNINITATELSAQKEEALQNLFAAFGDEEESLLALQKAVDNALLQRVLASENGRPIIGESGPLLVEFSDYQCGYCKQMYPLLLAAVAEGRARLLVVELPVLGALSQTAAGYALAAQRQGKYAEFHDALMRQGRLSEEFLQEAAANMGLDMTQMQTDLANGTLWDELERNYKLAGLLNVQGTPALVANGKIARGALDEQALRQLLTEE